MKFQPALNKTFCTTWTPPTQLPYYPVNAGVLRGSILGSTLFLIYINDLPDDVICDIAIYARDTTLYSKCDQAFDLWQQQILHMPPLLNRWLIVKM